MQESLSCPLPRVPCVPIIPELHFYDASAEGDRELFRLIGYQKLTIPTLLTEFVIPNLITQPNWLLYPLIDFILDTIPVTDKPHLIRFLSEAPFVRVRDKNGTEGATRLKPSDIIDQK